MQFRATSLRDAYVIYLEPVRDDRGFFARTFCVREFASHGIETNFPEHSVSLSTRKGTLRGMHYQQLPHGEVKVVRCLRGTIWDVIIDIRPASPTYRRWQGLELSSANGRQLYVPKGFAHGFQALVDEVEVNYLISEPYIPEAARGIRYNDSAFGIVWPLPIVAISPRDMSWPDFIG
jgi:dTDP-4-dehydrorhamnose 3,5-epimerase